MNTFSDVTQFECEVMPNSSNSLLMFDVKLINLKLFLHIK